MNISRRSFFSITGAAVVAPGQMLEAGGFHKVAPAPQFKSGDILTAESLNRRFDEIIQYIKYGDISHRDLANGVARLIETKQDFARRAAS